MPRSEPGKGRPLLLILLGDEKNSGAGEVRGPMPDGNQSVMGVHIGEDYSTSDRPVVVKVQSGFPPEYVAARLQDLIAWLKREQFGFWGEVPEELPDYVRKQAEEDARRLRIGQAPAPVEVVVEEGLEDDIICRISVVRKRQG